MTTLRNTSDKTLALYMRIYRKTVSNLHIREQIIRSVASDYTVGPTIIWTESPDELAIFTIDENYTNFIGFEGSFANPRSPKYLKKMIGGMRMKKGTILIKESTGNAVDAMHIHVHFCGYRIDENGIFTIFDPSWHRADPGIYSTTAFYDSLDAFTIAYIHAEPMRKHHWQSILSNDVFCQTWSLRWLMYDTRAFSLPRSIDDARLHLSKYITEFTGNILENLDEYMAILPEYKREGMEPRVVFETVLRKVSTILKLF